MLFVVDGLPLYDPRDGQTRFTENAAVIAWNVARGIMLPDGSVYGVGIPEEDLPAAEWAQAMNTCDSEGYKYGGEVSIATPDKGGETPLDVLEEIGLSANMRFAAVAGRLHVQVGAPALPSRFITDADVLVSQPESMTPFVPQAEVVNALHASHPLPDQRWQVKEAPPLYSADDEAADGERKPISLDFPGVADPEQVQKLMKSMLADHRRQRQHTLAIPPSESTILPLGTLAWTSDINGYQGKLFEAAEIAIDAASLCVTVALRERDPSDYDWNSQTDYTPVTPGPIEVPEPNPVQLEGLTAEGVTIIGEGGQARPALRISWTDDLIEPSPIRWEVRLATGEAVSSGSEHGLTAPEHVISQGILADTDYQVRIQIVAHMETAWTGWVSVTSPDVRIGAADIEPNTITVDAIDTESFAATGLALFGGDVKSSNYAPGVSGWRIESDGNAEFNNLVARSWIQAGAVSDGFEHLDASERTALHNDVISESNTGPWTSNQFWNIAAWVRYRTYQRYYVTVPSGDWGGGETYNQWYARTKVLFQKRALLGGSWSSWSTIHTFNASPGNFNWVSGKITLTDIGEYDDVGFRLLCSHYQWFDKNRSNKLSEPIVPNIGKSAMIVKAVAK